MYLILRLGKVPASSESPHPAIRVLEFMPIDKF